MKGDPERLLRSLSTATNFGLGDLAEIIPVPIAAGEPRRILTDAARFASEQCFDWLLAVSAAETLSPDIFAKTAPALRIHDAVWGGAGSVTSAATVPLERITRLAAQDVPTFFHAALRWWIGPTHFVRPEAALRALDAVASPAWYADYMENLWRHSRAYKTAQALTLFHGGVPPVAEEDRRRLLEML